MDFLETQEEGHRKPHKVVGAGLEVGIARRGTEPADIVHLEAQDLHKKAVDSLLGTRSFAGTVQAEGCCRSLLAVADLGSSSYSSQGGHSSSFLGAERSGTRIEASEESGLVSRGWERETYRAGLDCSLFLPLLRDRET